MYGGNHEILKFGLCVMLSYDGEQWINVRIFSQREICSLQTDFVYILLIFLFKRITKKTHIHGTASVLGTDKMVPSMEINAYFNLKRDRKMCVCPLFDIIFKVQPLSLSALHSFSEFVWAKFRMNIWLYSCKRSTRHTLTTCILFYRCTKSMCCYIICISTSVLFTSHSSGLPGTQPSLPKIKLWLFLFEMKMS